MRLEMDGSPQDPGPYWVTSYPWSVPREDLGDNYPAVLGVMNATAKKLDKDPKWRELYEVIDAVSGGSWICFRYDVVIPPYDSWLSPLRGYGSAKRRRHGSRGARRAGRARVV